MPGCNFAKRRARRKGAPRKLDLQPYLGTQMSIDGQETSSAGMDKAKKAHSATEDASQWPADLPGRRGTQLIVANLEHWWFSLGYGKSTGFELYPFSPF